jgi:hypothetical protein
MKVGIDIGNGSALALWVTCAFKKTQFQYGIEQYYYLFDEAESWR